MPSEEETNELVNRMVITGSKLYQEMEQGLRKQVQSLTERLAKSEAVVGKLPVTADGTRVVPHMDRIYHPSKPGWSFHAYGDKEQSAMDVSRPATDGYMKGCFVPVSDCYSTSEAALAARSEGGE